MNKTTEIVNAKINPTNRQYKFKNQKIKVMSDKFKPTKHKHNKNKKHKLNKKK